MKKDLVIKDKINEINGKDMLITNLTDQLSQQDTANNYLDEIKVKDQMIKERDL